MKQFYITLGMLATFFFYVPSSYACRFLADQRPLSTRINDYDTAFIGKVVKAKSKEGTGDTDAEFIVLAPVKGAPINNDKVKVISHMGSCSHRFEMDEIWLITTDGKQKPYITSVADASTLIQDGRGLPVQGWEIVEPLLAANVFTKLAEENKCVAATLSLQNYFKEMPRTCTADEDCGGFFINPFPCQQAIIARKDAMSEDTKPLQNLQAAVREACPLKTEQIPACEAPMIDAICDQGTCRDKGSVAKP